MSNSKRATIGPAATACGSVVVWLQ